MKYWRIEKEWNYFSNKQLDLLKALRTNIYVQRVIVTHCIIAINPSIYVNMIIWLERKKYRVDKSALTKLYGDKEVCHPTPTVG